MASNKIPMARALLPIVVLVASFPVGLPLSPFAEECGDTVDEGTMAEMKSYKKIHVMTFIPCSQPNGNNFDLCYWADDIPILAMSLDQINSDPNLLPGYQLVLDVVKSKCDSAAVSLVNFHANIAQTLLYHQPVHHMILGPACTVATVPVAELSGKYLNINQVSYTASGMQFQNRERFPRLYTLQPLVFSYNEAYVHLIEYFGWKRVAVINQVNTLFSATATDLLDKLRNANIDVEHFGSYDSDPAQELKIIKKKDLRIIIALFEPHTPLARTLWCEAVKQGLADHLHVWFTPVWATLNLTTELNDSCTNDDIRRALAHTFGTLGSDFVVEEESSAVLASGQLATDFYNQLECYKQAFKIKYPEKNPDMLVDVTFKEGYVYDSIWAIALALNRTIEQGIALENFTYKNKEMADIIQEELRNSNFLGISGQVMFTPNASEETGFRRDPFLEIWQYDNTGTLQMIGIYNTSGANIRNNNLSASWPDTGRPADGSTPITVHYPLWALIIVFITIGIGVICAIICLVVTLAYRKHKAFKRSTFRLNVIICIGIILGFLGDLVHTLSVRILLEDIAGMIIVVNVTNWIYHISFVLAFGSLLMKTWRIYRIFCNPAMRKRKYLDDQYLMLAVSAIVAFDVVFLIAMTIIAPNSWVKGEYVDPVDGAKRFIVYYASGTELYGVFSSVLLAAYALLLLFGMFMAYQIKQNVRSFYNKYNDSPIVNLSSLLALTLSFSSFALYFIITPTRETVGILLLLIVVRDGSWMFPMLAFMYLPMIFELVCEKYTGKSITRQRSTLSSLRWFKADSDRSCAHRISSISISSFAVEQVHQQMPPTEASPSLSLSHYHSPSSVEGNPQIKVELLSPQRGEAAESKAGESPHKKTSNDVPRDTLSCDEEEVLLTPLHQPQTRRRSILKIPPELNGSHENKRCQLHVQFTELQQPS